MQGVLASVQELAEWLESRGYDWGKEATQAALDSAEGGYSTSYWLRTPSGQATMRVAIANRGVGGIWANCSTTGVAPALKLDAMAIVFSQGNGTVDDPYVLQP